MIPRDRSAARQGRLLHRDLSGGGGPSCQWLWPSCQWRFVAASYSHGAGRVDPVGGGKVPLGVEFDPPTRGCVEPPVRSTIVIAQPVNAPARMKHIANLVFQPPSPER